MTDMNPVALLKQADGGGLFLKTLCAPEDNHKLVGQYFYTADQLKAAQVKVLREARERMAVTRAPNPLHFLDDMADEIERGEK